MALSKGGGGDELEHDVPPLRLTTGAPNISGAHETETGSPKTVVVRRRHHPGAG
jgi:hypothetical protein